MKLRIALAELFALLLLGGVLYLLLSEPEVRNVPLSEVENSITSSCTLDQMEKAGDMRLKRAFSLNAADFPDYIYYTPDNTMSVNELLILKLSSQAQKEEVLSALESRLSSQKTAFNGYGVDQTELLSNARIETAGDYVFFAVGNAQESWLNAARKVWEE